MRFLVLIVIIRISSGHPARRAGLSARRKDQVPCRTHGWGKLERQRVMGGGKLQGETNSSVLSHRCLADVTPYGALRSATLAEFPNCSFRTHLVTGLG
jgi:hypothetical protein